MEDDFEVKDGLRNEDNFKNGDNLKWRWPKYEDDLKLKKNWFRRPYPAWAYTTLVVRVIIMIRWLAIFLC